MSAWKFNLTPKNVPKIETKYRKITTALPVPESLEIFETLDRYESVSMHGQMPIVWDRAEGFQVHDPWGNSWIDFTSTIFVANAGHGNPKILEGVRKCLDKPLIHSYTFATSIRAKYLRKLIEATPPQFGKGFLLSAGTEATECSVKLMRMHGRTIKHSKIVIISFQGSMHGRTMAAEMLKGEPHQCTWIGFKDPNIYHLPFPYPWTARGHLEKEYDWERHFQEDIQALKAKGLDFYDIAGFMIESYLGWGAIFYPIAYIQALVNFAKAHDCLVTFDEIQGGFGRSGKLFVYQHYDVEPDLLCLGKGLSGSLPLSAVIGSQKIMDLPGFGSMSSTHSANPLGCAAGLANLEALETGNLVTKSARKGYTMHQHLQGLKKKYPDRISYIFGRGLLAGVLFKDPKTGKPDSLFASRVCEKAMQKGLLLVHTGRESIKIGPPLSISNEALLEGLTVLDDSIQETMLAG
ncbi:MAG: aspartate aminotransferase family protein [Candidatus Hodarchaeales archaeon]|jgi:4-aminobutyrate aminotransferase-like enzyme